MAFIIIVSARARIPLRSAARAAQWGEQPASESDWDLPAPEVSDRVGTQRYRDTAATGGVPGGPALCAVGVEKVAYL